MKARFIKEIGTIATFRAYWGDDCPSCYGGGQRGCHNAHLPLGKSDKLSDHRGFGRVEDYPVERWPLKCDHCPAVRPADANRQVFTRALYDSPSGQPEPGDLYWRKCYAQEARGCCFYGWTNCDGRHLVGILPNGAEWDIDSRASNCALPEDTTHRCWIRTGEPPQVDVGKSGRTCSAGAGSIAHSGWHGWLRNGEFVQA